MGSFLWFQHLYIKTIQKHLHHDALLQETVWMLFKPKYTFKHNLLNHHYLFTEVALYNSWPEIVVRFCYCTTCFIHNMHIQINLAYPLLWLSCFSMDFVRCFRCIDCHKILPVSNFHLLKFHYIMLMLANLSPACCPLISPSRWLTYYPTFLYRDLTPALV